MWGVIGAVYAAGVLIALIKLDADAFAGRLGVALLWPLGPLAFVVAIAILLVTSLVAFPLVAGAVLAAAAAAAFLV